MFALWCVWYGNLEGWAKKEYTNMIVWKLITVHPQVL